MEVSCVTESHRELFWSDHFELHVLVEKALNSELCKRNTSLECDCLSRRRLYSVLAQDVLVCIVCFVDKNRAVDEESFSTTPLA
jgi:hypothetical protein